ncbi:MAG: ImmA/IrrE family metallo-endopeptidase [Candidatus Bathyarchaeota archaeon]|nr:ImmA/IrrE family metallo-endopeptidase [Candidatus Termiticorpusculum sp.]
MTNERAIINKVTLVFLLSKKGVTTEYLSQKTNYKIEQIQEWLDVKNGELPTLNQARKIAEVLRVPFASLYMTVETITTLIPTKPNVQNRRIMDAISPDDSSVNLAIIDLLQARDFYIGTELLLERAVAKFIIQFNLEDNVKKWADKIRSDFGIDLDRQYKSQSGRQFYLYLKDRIEEQGIFVQEFIGVDNSAVRAMAICQDKNAMHIIGINKKDCTPAKIFSLIHELVHIIKKTSSICNAMYDKTDLQNREEIFCNAVAGEVLTPIEAINAIIKNDAYDFTKLEDIQKISKTFSVSREVIIRRLLDLGYINKNNYDTLSNLLYEEHIAKKEARRRQEEAGIEKPFRRNIAREAVDKTSNALSKAIYAGYCEDVFSKYDVAQILSINLKHIDNYFMEVASWVK